MATQLMVFHSEYHRYEDWRAALEGEVPDLKVILTGDVPDPALVKYTLTGSPPPQFFDQFENLELAINLGAGVDHLLGRTDLVHRPITRLSDPGMVRMMVSYVTFAVLRYARDMPEIESQQKRRQWKFIHQRDAGSFKVGFMGLGELGGASALEVARHGFDVRGWSRSGKQLPGVTCSHGMNTLDAFLPELDALVMLLPLTATTRKILDHRRLRLLKRGAKIINPGRGGLIDEAALIEELRSGHVGGATLDTFEVEPLGEESPLWDMPNVLITPHLAARPHPKEAARQIADNIDRLRNGRPASFSVDPAKGY
ncbi:glyoxylate/hydroxypyruvate reductase A [Bradyrhizobium prioriisuperbiae]|uniref:2-hydroxyacid dehydrogenase n=1 Tax=Bradyrhizobium prioriisuperbiae TaxID=2854389 RepID=UPI0028E46FD1|nr:glyoxylate/hydroxypyruvate reductase A [Bradyrhizobium prioritasuperba]